MTDLFHDKAADWDSRPVPLQISEGVFAALADAVPLSPGLTVLDFGAGTGLLSGKLAPSVGRVLAVDISPAMLEQLSKKPELAGKVDVFCQDLVERPIGRTADLVVSAMAMHHVEDTPALLRALFAHLVPGGRLAVADLDTEPGDFHAAGTEGVYHHGFARDELRAMLGDAGFVDIAVRTACEVHKEDRRYSIFLATAMRPA
ncbi:MAG TPA: class I SAM-dependent methyltransferase [Kofleriaceae bacterium]